MIKFIMIKIITQNLIDDAIRFATISYESDMLYIKVASTLLKVIHMHTLRKR